MRVQGKNNMVEKIYQGNIYFMLHEYFYVCMFDSKHIRNPKKDVRTSISLRMWLVDDMAWDNLMLEVIDPVTHVMIDISIKVQIAIVKK